MENQAHLEKLVDRYLNNRATAEELEVFVHLQKQGVLDEILEARLNQRVLASERTGYSGTVKHLWPMAAIIALLLVSGILLYFSGGFLQSVVQPLAMVEVKTGPRELKTIRLEDGTVITLNQHSTIRFANDWGEGESRVVELLSGEAFFEVQQTVDRKTFVVKTTSGMEVRVLGTEFNVSAKPEETYVYLKEGKVKLSTNKENALLSPGELASYSEGNQAIVIEVADEDQWLAWKKNLFVFEDARLQEVARELEEYYGIRITLPATGYSHLRFTGKISRKNMDTVMAVISETLNLKVIRQGPYVKFQIIR